MMMLRIIALAATLAAAAVCNDALANPDPDAPCVTLATRARNLPAPEWRKGVEQALAPALVIDKDRGAPNAPESPLEASLTRLPWVQAAVGDYGGNLLSKFISRLPGYDIYMVSTYQGSASCQSTAFIKAPEGSEPTKIPAPKELKEGEMLCWTQSGKLGLVDGQAAYIEGGADNDHTFDTSYEIVPRIEGGWAQGCTVSFRFHTEFEVAARHCGDAKVCAAANSLVVKVARAYKDFRQRFGSLRLPFDPGLQRKTSAARQRLIEGRAFVGDVPVFPRFGDKDESIYGGSFSYVGFQLFPLQIGGRWYVAAIGHEGVGWRETNRTLLAIYTVNDGALAPKASFEVQATNAGLSDVKTSEVQIGDGG